MNLDRNKDGFNTQSTITLTAAGTLTETVLVSRGRTIVVDWMELRPDGANPLQIGYVDSAGVFIEFDSQTSDRLYDAGFKWRLPKGADLVAKATWAVGTTNAKVFVNGRYR